MGVRQSGRLSGASLTGFMFSYRVLGKRQKPFLLLLLISKQKSEATIDFRLKNNNNKTHKNMV